MMTVKDKRVLYNYKRLLLFWGKADLVLFRSKSWQTYLKDVASVVAVDKDGFIQKMPILFGSIRPRVFITSYLMKGIGYGVSLPRCKRVCLLLGQQRQVILSASENHSCHRATSQHKVFSTVKKNWKILNFYFKNNYR